MQRLLKPFLLFTLIISGLLSCDTGEDDVNVRIPQITTKSVDRVSGKTAAVTAEITLSGVSSITASGICWSEKGEPTINDSKTTDGITTIGEYTSTATGLLPGTKYYVRAYATNADGTGYGEVETFTTLSELKSIAIATAKTVIAKGLRQQFTATGTFTDNTTKDITKLVVWKSTNKTSATIDVNGMLVAETEGTTSISAALDGISSSVDVTIDKAQVMQLTITPADLDSLMPGRSAAVQASALYTDSTTADVTGSVTWSSSNTTTATISSVGVINTLKIGTTTISATINGVSATRDIRVLLMLGETYAGGIIFYIDATGEHGLAAAPSNQSESIVWMPAPGWVYSDDPGFTPDESVGAGAANTATLVGLIGEGTYAAKVCYDLVLNGHDDWFLPSIGELQLICQNLFQKGIGGLEMTNNGVGDFYWSSTHINKRRNVSWMQFSNGCQLRTDLGPDFEIRLRAVRKF